MPTQQEIEAAQEILTFSDIMRAYEFISPKIKAHKPFMVSGKDTWTQHTPQTKYRHIQGKIITILSSEAGYRPVSMIAKHGDNYHAFVLGNVWVGHNAALEDVREHRKLYGYIELAERQFGIDIRRGKLAENLFEEHAHSNHNSH